MTRINDKLFVYGSLLVNFETAIGDFLNLHARVLGEVYTKGKLFDLGQYPGLVQKPNTKQLIYGHLLQLLNPAQVFVTLDQYEGIDLDDPSGSEYRRALIQLEVNEFGIDQCWTYIYNFPTAGLKEIAGGNYTNFIKTSTTHQRFINSI